jgi:hypothetical protein
VTLGSLAMLWALVLPGSLAVVWAWVVAFSLETLGWSPVSSLRSVWSLAAAWPWLGLLPPAAVSFLLWVPLGESLAPLLLPFPLLAMLLVGWLWLQGTTQQQKGSE